MQCTIGTYSAVYMASKEDFKTTWNFTSVNLPNHYVSFDTHKVGVLGTLYFHFFYIVVYCSKVAVYCSAIPCSTV